MGYYDFTEDQYGPEPEDDDVLGVMSDSDDDIPFDNVGTAAASLELADFASLQPLGATGFLPIGAIAPPLGSGLAPVDMGILEPPAPEIPSVVGPAALNASTGESLHEPQPGEYLLWHAMGFGPYRLSVFETDSDYNIRRIVISFGVWDEVRTIQVTVPENSLASSFVQQFSTVFN